MSIVIAATGGYVPPRILTNHDLEKMVDTSDRWIVERTGIRERHIADAQTQTSDMAYFAAEQALARANLSAEQLDLILVATTTPDYVFPSASCLLQAKLKAVNAGAMDIQAACTGFIYGLETAFSMMRGNPKRYKNVLIVGAEKLSSIVDWKDRNTCILFGDGAGCMILSQREDELPDAYIAGHLGAIGSAAHLLTLPAGGCQNPATHETVESGMHFIKMAGSEVFKLAVNSMSKECTFVLKESGLTLNDVRYVIAHQANLRILNAVASALQMDIEKQFYVSVDHFGNTSAASVALTLDEMVSKNLIQRGDILLLTGFGAGMTLGALLLRY